MMRAIWTIEATFASMQVVVLASVQCVHERQKMWCLGNHQPETTKTGILEAEEKADEEEVLWSMIALGTAAPATLKMELMEAEENASMCERILADLESIFKRDANMWVHQVKVQIYFTKYTHLPTD